MPDWVVYVIERHGQYYTGITTDLPNRLRQHGDISLENLRRPT